MVPEQSASRIRELVDGKFEGTDRFLVDVKVSADGKIVVFLDADSGINANICREVSRYLESFIEDEGLAGERYVLEVSSPGLDQPLKLHRQYRKNIGRSVEVLLTDGKKKEGELLAVNNDQIIINEILKRKPTKKAEAEIPFEQIKSTKVQVTF